MIVLTIYCIYVRNLNYVTIFKIVVILLADINFSRINVCLCTTVISAKKEKAKIFLDIVIFADFTLNVTKIKFFLNNSFSDGNSKKSFNRFACFWPKGYQFGSLGKSHQNGDYLKEAMRKIVFPQESNLQSLGFRTGSL